MFRIFRCTIHYSRWRAFDAIATSNSEWRAANTDWFYALVSVLIQLRHPVQSPSTRWRIYSCANNPPLHFSALGRVSSSLQPLILVFAMRVTRITQRGIRNIVFCERFCRIDCRWLVFSQFHASSLGLRVAKAIFFYQAECKLTVPQLLLVLLF